MSQVKKSLISSGCSGGEMKVKFLLICWLIFVFLPLYSSSPVHITLQVKVLGDSDNDGLPDNWEMQYFGSLIYTSEDDPDNDGLSNMEEYNLNTSPSDNDTDDDGMPDGWEVNHALNPLVNDADGDADGDGFTNYQEYRASTDPQDAENHPTRPYIVEEDTCPCDGQGIEEGTRVPINTAIFVRVKSDAGIDEEGVEMWINGREVQNVEIKEVNKGDPRDVWIIYRQNEFEFGQLVTVEVYVQDVNTVPIEPNPYNFCFRVESIEEHQQAEENAPPVEEVVNDTQVIIRALDLIEGAMIIYDSTQPEIPECGLYFGPVDEIPPLDIADGVGMPVNLLPPTVFEVPVIIFIPCPGVTDVSSLDIYRYSPASGWVKAQPGDGWWVEDGYRVNHNDTDPPTIEIKVWHFSAAQAGSLPAPASEDGGGGGGGGGGCFITILSP